MSERSLLKELDLTTSKVFKTVLLPFFIVLLLFVFGLSAFFIQQTGEVIKSNYADNMKYWLTVGDKFQIQRAINHFNKEENDWNMQVIYSSYIFPENGKFDSSFYITLTHEIDIQDKKAQLVLKTKYPFLVVIGMSLLLIIFLLIIATPTKRNIAGIINEFKKPLNDFIEKMSKIDSIEKVEGINVDYQFSELNSLNKSFIEMNHRIVKQEKEIQEIEDEAFKSDLVKEVSHDIRSPLAAQKMLLDNIESKLDDYELEMMKTSVERIEQVADRILISHRKNLKKYNTDKLESFLEFKKNSINPNISLDFSIIDSTLTLNRDRFESVLSNLINNSIEADASNISINTKLRDNEYEICIKDNGKGIAPDILNSIGEKGFTYGKSEGNGIGIYTAIKSIESFGGFFQISSVLGKGTEIKISLPA